MKSFLFVLKKPAHSGSHLQETLDVVLTVAAFDQSVSLLLLDDAVFHLKKAQQPELVGLKAVAGIFAALEIYDVTDIYVEEESLLERGLQADDLCLPVIPVARQALAKLFGRFDVVFPG